MGRYAKFALAAPPTTTKKERKTIDVSTTEKLIAEAERRGLKVKEKKPSLFRRTLDIMMRPLYASAGVAKALIKGENVLQEAYKGIRGIEKETYSDVLGELGIKNKWVKGLAGFALDVVLDPTTYFGGALIKGGLMGAKAVAKPVAKAGAKIAPESALHLADAAKSLKDAFGAAFKFGYGTTKGLANEVSRVVNKMGIAKEEIIAKNIQRFGKAPDPKKMERATELMMNNRLVERGYKTGSIKYAKNPETNQLLNSMKQLGQEIAVEAKIKNPDKWYFPWIDVDRLQKSKIDQSVLLKIGSEGYRKQFKNLIADDKLLKKPIEAYSRREYQVVRDKIAGQTMEDMITVYGKAFKNPAEALVQGYKPIYKKSPLQFFPITIEKGKKIIPKPLAQEARKFKTADEFVKAQPKVYHGTLKKEAKKITEKGIKPGTPVFLRKGGERYGNIYGFSISTSKKISKGYGDTVLEFYINPTAKIAKGKDIPSEFFKKFPEGDILFNQVDVIKWAKKQGFDAIDIGNIQKTRAKYVLDINPFIEKEIQVFNKNILKTKSQLTDIFNQAKVAKEVVEEGTKILGVKKATPLGYLKETDAKFIDNYLFPEMKTIDILAKASGYDTFTRWFKTAVTAYFPAFHVRNYISGNVQNYQTIGAQAFDPRNHNTALGIMRNIFSKKAVGKNISLGGTTYNTKVLAKELEENFRGASRYISDIGDYVEEVVGNKFRMKKISKARQLGNFVEMNQKTVAMVGALRQGKKLPEAIKLAERAGFDYSKITKFESKIMKRAIPFYTFARKNAELQLRTFAKRPERIINQAKFANALGVMFGEKVSEEDVKGLPPWALSGLGFKVKGEKYFTKFGLPLEEFIERINEPMKTTLASLNPIVKFPLESKLGYDFFREQKLIDINKIAPASGELLLKAQKSGKMPEWLDQAINIRSYKYKGKTRYQMSPKILHVLRNIPTSRFQNTLERMFDKDLDKVNKWMAFLSGAKIYDIDIELQKYFQERDLRRDIEDQLLEVGIGTKGEYFTIYK